MSIVTPLDEKEKKKGHYWALLRLRLFAGLSKLEMSEKWAQYICPLGKRKVGIGKKITIWFIHTSYICSNFIANQLTLTKFVLFPCGSPGDVPF